VRVLVACERSGVVRRAFRALGHDAWSCDIVPADDGSEHHLIGDAIEAAYSRWATGVWDIIVAHPPCNHLAASGAQYWPAKQADGRQQEAIDFFLALFNAPASAVAVENPVGIIGTVFRKADQIIQPWQFGDPFNKKTCLWLRGLQPLTPTSIVEPTHNWGSNSYRSGARKKSALPSLHWGAKERSQSFPGIAAAMAAQWGGRAILEAEAA
jgi:hypothetical protein